MRRMHGMGAAGLAVLAGSLVMFGSEVQAAAAPSFEIVSNEIVERIDGINGRSITWEETQNAKGIKLRVKAEIPQDMKMWATDFNLAYLRETKEEDRSRCRAITTVVSSAEDQGEWIIGDYVKANAKQGTRYFDLICAVEDDVRQVSLQYSQPVVNGVRVRR